MMFANGKLKVLIPLDGSTPGESALTVIHPLIRSGPVECTLLHVAEPTGPTPDIEARLERHRQAIERLGVTTRIRTVRGIPGEEILHQAAGGEFDLVAMSTHGRRGLDRVVMGSVAEQVLRSSSIPTLLCRMGAWSDTWDKIVVALDGTPGAEEVLENVVFLATRLDATVHLLKVGLNVLLSNGYRGVAFEVAPQEHTDYLETVATRLRQQGVTVTTEHRQGLAAAEIVLFARDLGAGLICMTTQGLPDVLPGLDRSVAAEVIRQAPCPVYVRRMLGTLAPHA